MRKTFLSVCFFAMMCLVGKTGYSADIATNQMILRGVDKVTGRVSTIEAIVNQPFKFGTLTIIPQRCLTKPQEEMPENAVYLEIYEDVQEGPQKQIFKGWMFSSNPALSPLEHSIYDIWLLNCINKDITENVVLPDFVNPETDMDLVAEEDNPALAQEGEETNEKQENSVPSSDEAKPVLE